MNIDPTKKLLAVLDAFFNIEASEGDLTRATHEWLDKKAYGDDTRWRDEVARTWDHFVNGDMPKHNPGSLFKARELRWHVARGKSVQREQDAIHNELCALVERMSLVRTTFEHQDSKPDPDQLKLEALASMVARYCEWSTDIHELAACALEDANFHDDVPRVRVLMDAYL